MPRPAVARGRAAHSRGDPGRARRGAGGRRAEEAPRGHHGCGPGRSGGRLRAQAAGPRGRHPGGAEPGRHAHPARSRPYPALLRALRAADAAFRDGRSQGPGAHRRRADDGARGRWRPVPSGLRAGGDRARPYVRPAVGGGHRAAARDGGVRGRRRLGSHRARVRPVLALRVPGPPRFRAGPSNTSRS